MSDEATPTVEAAADALRDAIEHVNQCTIAFQTALLTDPDAKRSSKVFAVLGPATLALVGTAARLVTYWAGPAAKELDNRTLAALAPPDATGRPNILERMAVIGEVITTAATLSGTGAQPDTTKGPVH